jgi:N-acyl amino acid synthase of PEP-CTERM/exosortase system
MMQKTSSLVEDFQEYFTLHLVKSQQQLDQAYRIRYRVYCEEFGYEPVDAFPEQQEVDEFDPASLHCLIVHKSSGMAAGTVRLVCVDDNSVMPMERFCGDAMDRDFIDGLGAPRSTMCEFSRLAVDGAFRRRVGEKATRFGEIAAMDISRREERTFSLIAVSTFIAAFAASDIIGRPNCFAMMEPFLPRMLRRSGVRVQAAGTPTDYHGQRAPYFITREAAVEGMTPELQELYYSILYRFKAESSEHGGAVPRCESIEFDRNFTGAAESATESFAGLRSVSASGFMS